MCLCRGSFAPGSKRAKIARRFVAGSLQKGFHRTPGIASVHVSLSTIICERGASRISLAGSTPPVITAKTVAPFLLARYAVNASVWTITDTARRDRSRPITDCSFDYVEKFVTGMPMHRQSRAGLKPRASGTAEASGEV
jgi:hypothetical protein